MIIAHAELYPSVDMSPFSPFLLPCSIISTLLRSLQSTFADSHSQNSIRIYNLAHGLPIPIRAPLNAPTRSHPAHLLPGAQCAKVLSCERHDISAQLEHQTPRRPPTNAHIHEDTWVGRRNGAWNCWSWCLHWHYCSWLLHKFDYRRNNSSSGFRRSMPIRHRHRLAFQRLCHLLM
jgi:hypothetical protein